MTSHLTITTERLDRAAVLALGPDWSELRSRSDAVGPFTTWEWVGAWVETAGRDVDLEVHVARDTASRRLLGVAPFQVDVIRRGPVSLRVLRLLTSGVTAPDHLDLLLDRDAPEPVARRLWDSVASRGGWDLLDLDGVVAGGRLAGAVDHAPDEVQPLPAPALALEGGWEAVEAGFSGRLRNNIRRYGRKLEAVEGFECRLVTDADDLDGTFASLVAHHQAIRTSAGDPGLFAQPQIEEFVLEASRRFLAAGALRMWTAEVDGEAIASILCMRAGPTVAFYTTGYDAEWSRLGPGRYVMARAVRGAVEEGAATFDFLRGDEPYKREWGAAARPLISIRRPTSTRGRLAWSARRVLGRARELLRRTD